MVALKPEFDEFHTRVRLDATRRQLVQDRVATLRDTIAKDERFLEFLTGEIFLQGSYPQHTIVRPVPPKGGFDVDVMVVVRGGIHQSSKAVYRRFVKLLREYTNYASIIEDHPRCIRLAYRGRDGEFQLDIVPAVETGDALMPYGAADFENDSWRPSNPKELISWVEGKNSEHGGFFSKAMKVLKRWRDLNPAFAGEMAPKSLPMSAFAGKHLPSAGRTLRARGFPHYSARFDGLDAFFVDMVIIMADCLLHKAGRPRIENPKNPNEDLAERWNPKAFEIFNYEIRKLANAAEFAFNAQRKQDSVDRWTRILGEDFPQTS